MIDRSVWRAINYTQNAYYKECFVDEMAHAAAADPYLYRRRLLRNSPRNLAVLDAAAKKADWFGPLPAGVSRGIAVNEACGSYCAQVVEVSIDGGGVRVHRVVSALDSGHVVNPLSVEMQTQGAVIFALTAALHGEITIKNGGVEQSNFDDYEMLRMADAPKVETVIVPSGDFWGGVGEPPVPPLAPAEIIGATLPAEISISTLAADQEPRFDQGDLTTRPAWAPRSLQGRLVCFIHIRRDPEAWRRTG